MPELKEASTFLGNIDLYFLSVMILFLIFRNELENVASSITLFFSSKISIGDRIQIGGGVKGKVISYGFNVTLRNKRDHYIAHVPASIVLKSEIKNFSLANGNEDL